MVGNVGGIVESMYAADNVKNQQHMAGSRTGSFSDYLDYALLNGRTGLLSGGLGFGSSYLNPLAGSSWQTLVLGALRDELKKKADEQKSESAQEEGVSQVRKKKPDWATIRVVEHYKAPVAESGAGRGICV